jgi:NADP-dependent 3-hydroxy acid dehydrogenase YdfG
MTAFAGKVVWMTGAGTGIGKAGALMFTQEAAAVALIGRRRDKLDEVAAEIQAIGGKAAVEALDVADRKQVGVAGKRLLKLPGRVDILVNNAGLNVVNRRLDEITAEDWDYILAVNLTGAFNMVQAVMPTMRNQKDGLIINIASTAANRVSGGIPDAPEPGRGEMGWPLRATCGRLGASRGALQRVPLGSRQARAFN